MSVTLKQIAERTGLSIPTVGNVLGRSAHRYSAETRRRVLGAVKELGYQPNSSARAIRQGRFDCATLILSRSHQHTHSNIPNGLLDGLDDELAKHDMHLTVSRLSDEELSRDDVLPKILRSHMADGMIVNYTHEIPPRMVDLVRAHHTPAVWLNAKLESDCVYPDDFAAARLATEQLLALGHRRIAFLQLLSSHLVSMSFAKWKPRMHYSVFDRTAGYEQAMREAGQNPRILRQDRFVDEEEQMAACRELLSESDRPTAILVYSEVEISALVSTAQQLGLSIPRDLSVLMFYPVSPWIAGQEISNVPLPTAEIGKRAVRMLLKKIKNPGQPCPAEAVAYGPVIGASVASVKN